MITKVEEWLSRIEALRSDMGEELKAGRNWEEFATVANAFIGLKRVAERLDQAKAEMESEARAEAFASIDLDKWKAEKEVQNG